VGLSEATGNQRVRAVIAKGCGEELGACRSLLDFALAELGAWSGRPIKRGADRIILAEALRATKTLGALIQLCEAGFGEQALMLDRSLFEGMAVAHWVSDHRRRAIGLFTRHEKFNRLLWYETLDALGWLDANDRNLRPSIEPKRRKELQQLFNPYGTKAWWRMSVPKLLGEIERQWDDQGRADLWKHHDIVYRLSNQILHSTVTSVSAAYTKRTSTALAMTASPSNQFVSQALYAAHWTYGQIFTLLIDVFELTSGQEFRRLWQASGQAFSTSAAVAPSQ
jgi:Family of unknown function (DUF5677)